MIEEDNREGQNDEEAIEIEGIVTDIKDAKSDETKSLREDLDRSKKDFLYLRAEFDNFRKRSIKERSDYIRFAGEQSFVALLDVLDNFERALQTEVTAENLESFKKGVHLIKDNFSSVMKKFGVIELPSEGVAFDPNHHEAIGSEETDEVKPGHISKVFRKTYKMHDKVIRPGQVIVAKEKLNENSEEKD